MVTRWDGIEEFLAVVDHGSFTRAAQHLEVSITIVSRRIAQLEQRLGFKLLNRTTRTVELTRAGEEYLNGCRQAVASLQLAHAAGQGEKAIPQGHINIAAIKGFAADIAAYLIPQYLALHPEVSVDLSVFVRDVDIRSQGIDVALLSGGGPEKTLRSELLHTRSFCMAAAPTYLALRGTPLTPEDLKQHDCVMADAPFWMVQDGDNERPIVLSGRSRVHGNVPGLLHAALNGLGVVYLTEHYIRPHIEAGRLVPVLQDYWISEMGTWLVHDYAGQPPLHITALIDHLRERMAAPGFDSRIRKLISPPSLVEEEFSASL